MASKIILYNNLITVHNGGALEAINTPQPTYNVSLANNITSSTPLISTVEDIGAVNWKVGDTLVLAPDISGVNSQIVQIFDIIDNHTIVPWPPIQEERLLNRYPSYINHVTNLSQQTKIEGNSST